ncbi:MAG: Maf family protein [Deltaproteobacteria bacterium]
MAFYPISQTRPLILASSSPRRRRLLEQIRLPFHVVASRIAEDETLANPSTAAQRLAEKKAESVHSPLRGRWVLGADTVVVLGRAVLGKPRDAQDAHSMLLRLSGRSHRVITGFCILDPSGQKAHSEAVVTRVDVKRLAGREIRSYVATGEPLGKAGGYAIQGLGAFMIEGISGSYTNVVGLPVCALVKALLEIGALEDFPFHTFAAKSPQG